MLQRSLSVAVEMLRPYLRESNVPRLKEYCLSKVYVVIPLRFMVAHNGFMK